MADCQECQARTKYWEGSDPQCAFPDDGDFQSHNWNCALANQVREMVYEGQTPMPERVDYRYCDDQKYATVYVDDKDVGALALWVTWYKQRGRTEQMWLLADHGRPRRPTATEIRTIVGNR